MFICICICICICILQYTHTHTHTHRYREMYVPYIVNEESLYGTGQLPKFAEDLFSTPHQDRNFYLIPTAEVPVTNMVRDTVLEAEELPLRMTVSVCARVGTCVRGGGLRCPQQAGLCGGRSQLNGVSPRRMTV